MALVGASGTAEDDLVLGDDEFQGEGAVIGGDLIIDDDGGDLVLDDDDLLADAPPVFQSDGGGREGIRMEVQEADKETAGGDCVIEAGSASGPGSSVGPSCYGAPVAEAETGNASKVVVVGNSGVGKTSILLRFAQDYYSGTNRSTIGVDLHSRPVRLANGSTLQMQLWDTAGQEQFASLTASYFRSAHAVVLVYDVTSPQSFAALPRWMQEVDRRAPVEVVKVVLGAKCDQVSTVGEVEAVAFAARHGARCERCSAKDATNVREIFERLAEQIYKAGFDTENGSRKGAVRLHSGRSQSTSAAPSKSKCC